MPEINQNPQLDTQQKEPKQVTKLTIAIVLTFIITALAASAATYFYLAGKDPTLSYLVQNKIAPHKNGVASLNSNAQPNLQPGAAQPTPYYAPGYVDITPVNVVSKTFASPYPISWQDQGSTFTLTDVKIGTFKAGNGLQKTDGGYGSYAPGDVINAVVLNLKIKTGTSTSSCINLKMRRVVGPDNDLILPNTRQFIFPSGGCTVSAGTTFSNNRVVFVVPDTDTDFAFDTGGVPEIFKLKLHDGTIDVANPDDSANSAGSVQRDQKRLTDIQKIMTALELYYNDNGGYPYQSSISTKISALVPSYMSSYPTAPVPADGDCTQSQNSYVYYSTSPSSYNLYFCLGAPTAGLSAGVHLVSPNGIE